MQSIKQIITRLIETMYRSRKVLLALSCLVVFVVTYVLILPAFTLEKDEAAELGGIDVPGVEAEEQADAPEASEEKSSDKSAAEKAEPAKAAKQNKKAESTGNLSFEGDGFTVAVDDKKSVLPGNTEVVASELLEKPTEGTKAERKAAEEAYKKYYELALDAVNEETKAGDIRTISFVKFYDIALQSAGEEVQPSKPVNVTIAYDEKQQKNMRVEEKGNVKIVHFSEDKDTGEITAELLQNKSVDVALDQKKMAETTFEAEGFSVYAVVYTVDLHYEVNGETFDFSFKGGGAASLRELIKTLNVADSVENESGVKLSKADIAEAFLRDVDKVEFSDESLVKVAKVEESTTAGDLKASLGLEPEYSAELTEEDIAEINAKEFSAPDWALISLKPFDTEETLTVTMKNGDVLTINVTDALHVNPDALVGKEVIIFDKTEKRALTSDWESNKYRTQFGSVEYGGEGSTMPENAHWIVEKYNGNYYLKSHDGKYLKIDNTNVSLVNSYYEATPLTIQMGGNPDYRIYALNDDRKILTYSENNEHPGFFAAPGGTGGTGNTRVWLGIDYATKTPDSVGDWMLYFDDDFSEITIHVGETISLRPYNKWEWKEGNTDVQSFHWNLIGKDNSYWNQIDSGDENGAHEDEWDDGGSGDNTAAFHWTAYVKKDTELVTHYWSVQGRATQTGVYYLTNTKNGKTLKVNVVDGGPVNKPKTITDTVDIPVNLFDYDKNFLLDPSDNSNLANNSRKNEAINYNNKPLYFMSSGAGDAGNPDPSHINRYTNSKANTGIVSSSLNSDGYPQLVRYTGDDGNLKYLFDTSDSAKSWHGGKNNDGMIAYPNVNGMFQKDSDGYYYYNSNTNYYYYNPVTGESKLYEHTYTQTSSEDKGSLVNDKPIGFFPFHDYDATKNLYVNQNHPLNHHVGMSMEIPFKMNEKKLDEKGQSIKFEFTGDDDLWVFAEWEDAQGNKHSKLILDVGGIHQPVYGYIDFTKDKSTSLNSMGLQPDVDYKLKVYYLERGGCDSNLAVRFNIPLTNIGDVPFTKRDVQTNDPLPGAVFGLYTDPSCSDVSKVRQATSDKSGHVLFNDVSIGTYYMKEITPPEGYCPSTAVYQVEVKAKNNAEITLINNDQAPSDFSYRVDNEKNSTNITFAKNWNNTSGKDNEKVSYTLFQIAEPTAGGDPVYDNVYVGACKVGGETKTGTTSNPITFNVTKNQPVTVADLPKTGVVGTTPVTYKYYALEAEVEGFSPDSPTPVTSGTYTITNKPIPPSATFEDVQVEKEWQGDGADQIGGYRFKLTQERAELSTSETQGSGAFHPIIIRTIDGDGTQHDSVYYVAAGKKIIIALTKVNDNSGPCTYKVGSSRKNYNGNATVTTDARFGGSVRIFSLKNNRKWGTDWTISVKGQTSNSDVSENPKDFISKLNNLIYTTVDSFDLKVNVPTADTANVDGNSYTATAANWKATVQNLPYYYYDSAARKYYTYRYKVEEVSIINAEGEEIEAVTNNQDGSGGESTHFTVTYDNSGSPLKITNTLKNSFELDIVKVDKSSPSTPLKGATFSIRKLVETNASSFETDTTFTVDAATTGENGHVKFEELPAGIYEIEETGLPAGYVLSNFGGKAYVKINASGMKLMKSEAGRAPNSWGELAAADSDSDYLTLEASTLTVKNEPGAELPHTGGIGNTIFYILGAMLAIGCAVVLASRRRLRRD